MGISRKNIRNSKAHTNTFINYKMFFNHPTMFETPMFYQPRPVYYQRRPDPRMRPRTVYRRPQPERIFNFSPFMNELDGIYGFPSARQQTNENECNCRNCSSRFEEQVQKMKTETESLESRSLQETPEINHVSENKEHSETESYEAEK